MFWSENEITFCVKMNARNRNTFYKQKPDRINIIMQLLDNNQFSTFINAQVCNTETDLSMI